MLNNYCTCTDQHLYCKGDIKSCKCAYCNKPPYAVYDVELREYQRKQRKLKIDKLWCLGMLIAAIPFIVIFTKITIFYD